MDGDFVSHCCYTGIYQVGVPFRSMPVFANNERREKIGEKKQHLSYTAPLVPRSVSGVCPVRVW